MKRKAKFVAAALCGLLCLVAARADAGSPLFGIHTEQDWRDALQTGLIREVPGTVFEQMVAEEEAWPDEYKTAEFFTPQLEVFSDFDGEAGLYMAWGNDDGSQVRRAAAWDYVYPQDPNLNGTTIDFSIFPPFPSTLFSLNLIDANGNYREWIWHAGNPGEPLPGQWSTLSINPATGASNWPTFGGSPFIHNVPGFSFDLSSIQILRFNENISWTPGFPPGPMGNVPDGWVWNAWNHVQVTPEPGTLFVWSALIGLGLGYGWWRRRR